MLSPSKLYLVVTVLSLSVSVQSLSAQSPAAAQSRARQVTAFAFGEHVRFTSLGELIQIRLEVINSSGDVVFDSGFKTGNVLDWSVKDKQDKPLVGGSYLCLFTVKDSSGQINRRNAIANFIDHSITLTQPERSLLTAAQADAAGIEDQDNGLTILEAGGAAATAVLAHDGSTAHLVSGSGGLSISGGDFFANRVLEHIRLTGEGNLGIGISNPQAKLDVAGLIRTDTGIVFPDGTIQYSAARKTLGVGSLAPEGSKQSHRQGAGLAPDASGTGTTGKIPKWQDGPAGVLNDSNLSEVTGAIGINGTPNTNFRLDVNGSTRIRGSNPGFYLEGLGAGGNIWLFQTVDDDGRFRLFSQDNVNPGVERLTIKLSTGNFGIGTTNPTSRLEVAGNISTSAIKGTNASTIIFSRGVHGAATGASGATIGVLGESTSTSGTGVAGLSSSNTGTTSGVSGQSDSTSGRGVSGEATAATGTTYGGRFESASTAGFGVYGLASANAGSNYGGWFETNSTFGTGLLGQASAATGTSYGVRGLSAGTAGRGVYGQATAATGTTYGVYGQTSSTDGRAVYGLATAATGVTYGGRFEVSSEHGYPVYALATSTTGATRAGVFVSHAENGRGIYAEASDFFGPNYGVYGQSALGSYGLYSSSDIGAAGTKSFRIDHPDDPANKYLLHYAAESPEVINFYRGTVLLDVAGEAVVELPHYFAKINKDPSYQLTAIGAAMPGLYVAEEIDAAALIAGATAGPGEAAPVCSFRIVGGAPGAKVSWRVEAVRNDRWIQKRAAPVEVEKQGIERGKYQRPELYGQPAAMGMNYDAATERPEPARRP